MGDRKQNGSAGVMRSLRPAFWLCLTGALVVVASGCSLHSDREYSDTRKVQVQFFSPPGAEVVLRGWGDARYERICPTTADSEHRLEEMPEKYAIYNLPSGKHEFMYTSAEGFPGVTIYGELQVFTPRDKHTAHFVRKSFIPIRLPARYYRDDASLHPTVGASQAALTKMEVEHLAEGDLIQKVYFVADMDAISRDIDRIEYRLEQLRSAEKVLNAEAELIDSRYEDYRRDAIYSDPTYSYDAAMDAMIGADRKFIQLEAQRQKMEVQRYKLHQQREKLNHERRIRDTLLKSIRIINRAGALVLATPENQWPYHDTFVQVARPRVYDGITVANGEYRLGSFKLHPLGDVLAVMQVGGRHMHWDIPFEGPQQESTVAANR